MPLVSVILPTYNRANTILRAIESVQNQTLQDWELLVVDDGRSSQSILSFHATRTNQLMTCGFDSSMRRRNG
jgi:glycosyltransferase involved in cell wall biosynthesis